jgi:hypothetical protein
MSAPPAPKPSIKRVLKGCLLSGIFSQDPLRKRINAITQQWGLSCIYFGLNESIPGPTQRVCLMKIKIPIDTIGAFSYFNLTG